MHWPEVPQIWDDREQQTHTTNTLCWSVSVGKMWQLRNCSQDKKTGNILLSHFSNQTEVPSMLQDLKVSLCPCNRPGSLVRAWGGKHYTFLGGGGRDKRTKKCLQLLLQVLPFCAKRKLCVYLLCYIEVSAMCKLILYALKHSHLLNISLR